MITNDGYITQLPHVSRHANGSLLVFAGGIKKEGKSGQSDRLSDECPLQATLSYVRVFEKRKDGRIVINVTAIRPAAQVL